MKNLYPKNKGKVYPSPSAAVVNPSSSSSSSSSSSFPPNSSNRDAISVLNLLPTAILALVSILSLQDKEVLAYLITRSMKTTNPFSVDEEKKRYYCKKTNSNSTHLKPPIFDCGCFDCYTSYWFRWDSSPNRELIHQAIESFEDHLTNGELSSKKKNGRGGKKKDNNNNNKTAGRRGNEKSFNRINRHLEKDNDDAETDKEEEKKKNNSNSSSFVSVLLPTEAAVPLPLALALEKEKKAVDFLVGASEFKSEEEMGSEESREQTQSQLDDVSGEMKQTVEEEQEEEEALQLPASLNRGLVRKVLPDVLGLFNSRLWSLWNPTV